MNVCSVLLPAYLYCFVCYALSVCDGYGVAIMADNGDVCRLMIRSQAPCRGRSR